MASLKEVRNRINSVVSTQQITKAMKMVAAAKLRRSQDAIVQIRPYVQKLQSIISNVSTSENDTDSPFFIERPLNNVLIVVVTSDRGLCGAFNSSVFKAVGQLIRSKYSQQQSNITLMCVGKKGFDFYKKREYKVEAQFFELFSSLNFDSAKTAAEYTMSSFQKGTYDEVVLVYNEFKNVATQVVRTEQFLPITQIDSASSQASNTDYIFEPSKEVIMQELIPKMLKIKFYRALLESNASENGARMTAMDKATENAGELLKELKLVYNRTRQAAITKEILEIVGGAEALNG